MNVIKVHEEAHNKGKKGNEDWLFSVFLIYFICGHDFRVLSTILWLIVILELKSDEKCSETVVSRVPAGGVRAALLHCRMLAVCNLSNVCQSFEAN